MNVLMALYMAVVFVAQIGIAAPAAAPASGQSPMPAQATLAVAPGVPLPCPQLCPCDVQQPCGNVASWSWQHDNQNDNEWPADHGG